MGIKLLMLLVQGRTPDMVTLTKFDIALLIYAVIAFGIIAIIALLIAILKKE